LKLPLFIISDTHFQIDLSPNENKKRKLLSILLEKIEKTGGTLIIGGDFFDFWFDFKIKPPENYLEILQKLYKLSSKGIEIHYIAGNHDYWNFSTLEKFGIQFYKGNLDFKIDNKKIHLTHGDGILDSDKYYRFLSSLIRHPIFIKLFSLLGQKNGYNIGKLVSWFSKSLHDNSLSKKIIIKKKLINHIFTKLYKKYDTILIGHYHFNEIIKVKDKTTIFLGNWVDNYTLTTFDGNKWAQNDLIDKL
tara:strand:- start:824 stop:1564 length:741 start_codon:yes stop_codon:yes gene_type:complete